MIWCLPSKKETTSSLIWMRWKRSSSRHLKFTEAQKSGKILINTRSIIKMLRSTMKNKSWSNSSSRRNKRTLEKWTLYRVIFSCRPETGKALCHLWMWDSLRFLKGRDQLRNYQKSRLFNNKYRRKRTSKKVSQRWEYPTDLGCLTILSKASSTVR